jgi:hypothetical protein
MATQRPINEGQFITPPTNNVEQDHRNLNFRPCPGGGDHIRANNKV